MEMGNNIIWDYTPEDYQSGEGLPDGMYRWFPGSDSSKGKLPTDLYKRILEENPEPDRGLLKPPKLDDYIVDHIPKGVLVNDEKLEAFHADLGRTIRPYVTMATVLFEEPSDMLCKCQQGIALGVNAMAKITIQRKCAILKALDFSERGIDQWIEKASSSREWLFGDAFKSEFESRRPRKAPSYRKDGGQKGRSIAQPILAPAPVYTEVQRQPQYPPQTREYKPPATSFANHERKATGPRRGGYSFTPKNQFGRTGPQ